MEIKNVRVLPNPTYFENVCSPDKVVCKVKSNKKGGPCSCKYVIKSLKLMKMLIRFHSAKTQVFPQEIPAKLKQCISPKLD